MTASHQIKGLLAGLVTFAVMGTAMAQSTPPNPNVTNPPVGAGQQSSQGTPMGTTGTSGATGAPGMTAPRSTMGAAPDTTTAAASPRPMRADRN